MPKGSPDYSAVVGEVLGARAYEDYKLSAYVSQAANTMTTYDILTVPTGYEVILSHGIVSVRGTDTGHAYTLYVAGAIRHNSYLEDLLVISYSRYVFATEGQLIQVKFTNYDAVTRLFGWATLGIRLTIGTKPPKFQYDAGKPPEVEADESLIFIEDSFFGRRWVKAKQKPIGEPLNEIIEYNKAMRGRKKHNGS
jgi:hypothetical protein